MQHDKTYFDPGDSFRRSPQTVERGASRQLAKGYISWENFSACTIVGAAALRDELWKEDDFTTQLFNFRSGLWLVQQAPIYCISLDLLRALQATDVLEANRLVGDLAIAVPTFALLFPQNAVRTVEGAVIDFLFCHVADARFPQWSQGRGFGIEIPYLEHEFYRNVGWVSLDCAGNTWFSGVGIDDGGRLQLFRNSDSVLESLSEVVLQVQFLLAYRRDLLGEDRSGQSKEASHRARKDNAPRQPRWLGRYYQGTMSEFRGGSHASPIPHLRRGHFRRVVEGKRELGGRKWVWIEPTYVNL